MVKLLYTLLFVCVSLQTIFCQSEIDCVNPNGDVGSCIVFQSCDHYVNVLNALGVERAKKILRKAHCGYDGTKPKVCCPLLASSSGDFIPAFPDPPLCGFSDPIFKKVIGGDNAHLNDFPWMALLGYTNSVFSTSWKCGGSLISERHVLTAAHCVYNLEHLLYIVRLGELDLSREDDGSHPVDFTIKRKITHELYNPNTKDNDIAILVLQTDAEFTKSILPICIPKGPKWENESFTKWNPFIAGWGRTTFKGKPSSILTVAQLPILDNSFCRKAFKDYKSQTFDQRVLCAGLTGKDSCSGDSGGPLMIGMSNIEISALNFYAIGIISYGRGCALPEFPSVFTRVTEFLPWIEKKVLGVTIEYRNWL